MSHVEKSRGPWWRRGIVIAALAALAAFGIQHHLHPEKRQFLQYTTTSPIMHQRLGVPD